MKSQGTLVAKTILKSDAKDQGLTLPDFKPYYEALVIKTGGTGMKTNI